VRTFYALRDTRTPVVVGAVAVVANIGLSWALTRAGAGLAGLALSFSIANTLELGLLLWLLGRRIGTLGRSFWWALARMALAGVVVAAALAPLRAWSSAFVPAINPEQAYSWPADFAGLAAWLVLAGLAGAALYVAAAVLLRIPELARFRGVLRRLG
jgi:putative peptidoglycan lipid II flippase